MEPLPSAASDPDDDPPPACKFAPFLSRFLISARAVALVVFNRSLLVTRRLRISHLLVAATAILSRYLPSLLTVLEGISSLLVGCGAEVP